MEEQDSKKGFSGVQVFIIAAICMTITAGVVLFITSAMFSQAPFSPVVLTPGEKIQLEKKIDLLDSGRPGQLGRDKPKAESVDVNGPLAEPYTEKDADRTITFTEREINSLLANNTNLAERVAVDLSRDLISINMLVPVERDFPILGGKILKIKAGAELSYAQRPVVIFRGISIMGVPLPKAWLGGMKNIDLISEFGTEEGFWKAFADGVESLQIIEGAMQIKLRE